MQYSHFSGAVAQVVSLWEGTRVLYNSGASTSACSASVPVKMPRSSMADRGNLPGRCSMPLNHSLNVCGGLPLKSAMVATAPSK